MGLRNFLLSTFLSRDETSYIRMPLTIQNESSQTLRKYVRTKYRLHRYVTQLNQ